MSSPSATIELIKSNCQILKKDGIEHDFQSISIVDDANVLLLELWRDNKPYGFSISAKYESSDDYLFKFNLNKRSKIISERDEMLIIHDPEDSGVSFGLEFGFKNQADLFLDAFNKSISALSDSNRTSSIKESLKAPMKKKKSSKDLKKQGSFTTDGIGSTSKFGSLRRQGSGTFARVFKRSSSKNNLTQVTQVVAKPISIPSPPKSSKKHERKSSFGRRGSFGRKGSIGRKGSTGRSGSIGKSSGSFSNPSTANSKFKESKSGNESGGRPRAPSITGGKTEKMLKFFLYPVPDPIIYGVDMDTTVTDVIENLSHDCNNILGIDSQGFKLYAIEGDDSEDRLLQYNEKVLLIYNVWDRRYKKRLGIDPENVNHLFTFRHPEDLTYMEHKNSQNRSSEQTQNQKIDTQAPDKSFNYERIDRGDENDPLDATAWDNLPRVRKLKNELITQFQSKVKNQRVLEMEIPQPIMMHYMPKYEPGIRKRKSYLGIIIKLSATHREVKYGSYTIGKHVDMDKVAFDDGFYVMTITEIIKDKDFPGAFTIIFQDETAMHLKFPNSDSYISWFDGLRAIHGEPLSCPESISEVNSFTNMEVALRIHELISSDSKVRSVSDGLMFLKDEIPAIPELPDNYDFSVVEEEVDEIEQARVIQNSTEHQFNTFYQDVPMRIS